MCNAIDRAIISMLYRHLPFVYRFAIISAAKVDFALFINYHNLISFINLGD